ncbi:GNAT family N-acetyltransferase [Kribbella qitaiheensis]|uniref:GNAT family N-acetyltransferase n=1 Tax=Kribbella qitaiheensis TaxID=1544730 RepID=A0A7G6WS65_9ACTN|nr:GNAT family N-acetyltransferase [Kribbella qitaiheensis]QNE16830.1 GNAT family N-acetyltransferase [Kribbella qitaiheensis]
MAGEIRFEERAADDAQLLVLLKAAFAELVERYGAVGRSQVKGDARYLVVLGDAGIAIGCGAVQAFGPGTEHPGDGELKRMYVVPGSRGRGYARALLGGLEELARVAGHPVLRLATGERQPEGIALYESSGYARTAPWGKYVDQPLTHCYAKDLREL